MTTKGFGCCERFKLNIHKVLSYMIVKNRIIQHHISILILQIYTCFRMVAHYFKHITTEQVKSTNPSTELDNDTLPVELSTGVRETLLNCI